MQTRFEQLITNLQDENLTEDEIASELSEIQKEVRVKAQLRTTDTETMVVT